MSSGDHKLDALLAGGSMHGGGMDDFYAEQEKKAKQKEKMDKVWGRTSAAAGVHTPGRRFNPHIPLSSPPLSPPPPSAPHPGSLSSPCQQWVKGEGPSTFALTTSTAEVTADELLRQLEDDVKIADIVGREPVMKEAPISLKNKGISPKRGTPGKGVKPKSGGARPAVPLKVRPPRLVRLRSTACANQSRMGL